MLMEVGAANEALDLLSELRLENDESLELWYLLCCAAGQAGETELALEEAQAAIEYASSEACPEEEREWLGPLHEALEEAGARNKDA